MNNKYTINEGNDALKRVRLMMLYQLGKTLNENVEVISEQPDSKFDTPETKSILRKGQEELDKKQAEEKDKEEKIDKEETDWLTKYIQLSTPLNTSNNSDTIIIPRDSEYTMWKDSDNRQKSIFKSWLGSSRMSEVPDETLLKKILPNGTLRYFYTPDNLSWGVRLTHTEGTKDWKFQGYKNKSSNQLYDYKKYVKEPIPKTLTDDPSWWDYISNYFETHDWVKELIWIIAAAVAGALSGGVASALILEAGLAAELSIAGLRVSTKILAAYLAEAAVWSTKAGIEYSEGKNISAAISLFFGFVLPIMHESYLAKITGNGVTRNSVILLGNKLLGKSPEEIKILFLKSAAKGGLSNAEKKLFKKIMTTPVEVWKKGVIETVEGASSKLVSEGKDPTQTLWKIMKENKIDIFSKMPWYKKIPLTLTNDFVFITLMAKTAQKFGLTDLPPEFTKKVGDIYQQEVKKGNGKKFTKDYEELIIKSKNFQELEKNFKSQYKSKRTNEDIINDINNDPDFADTPVNQSNNTNTPEDDGLQPSLNN
jgi:hypothetical protein